jgi:hypothetical protein
MIGGRAEIERGEVREGMGGRGDRRGEETEGEGRWGRDWNWAETGGKGWGVGDRRGRDRRGRKAGQRREGIRIRELREWRRGGEGREGQRREGKRRVGRGGEWKWRKGAEGKGIGKRDAARVQHWAVQCALFILSEDFRGHFSEVTYWLLMTTKQNLYIVGT